MCFSAWFCFLLKWEFWKWESQNENQKRFPYSQNDFLGFSQSNFVFPKLFLRTQKNEMRTKLTTPSLSVLLKYKSTYLSYMKSHVCQQMHVHYKLGISIIIRICVFLELVLIHLQCYLKKVRENTVLFSALNWLLIYDSSKSDLNSIPIIVDFIWTEI